MKYTVKIEGRAFTVEVGDLQERPVKAVIEGETFEVWPEATPEGAADQRISPERQSAAAPVAVTPPAAAPASANTSGRTILAPIPGVIVSVAVQPGAAVETGQEVCVLEAMKMKSPIRAPRAGVIAAVHVSAGQQVKHREALVDYAA